MVYEAAYKSLRAVLIVAPVAVSAGLTHPLYAVVARRLPGPVLVTLG